MFIIPETCRKSRRCSGGSTPYVPLICHPSVYLWRLRKVAWVDLAHAKLMQAIRHIRNAGVESFIVLYSTRVDFWSFLHNHRIFPAGLKSDLMWHVMQYVSVNCASVQSWTFWLEPPPALYHISVVCSATWKRDTLARFEISHVGHSCSERRSVIWVNRSLVGVTRRFFTFPSFGAGQHGLREEVIKNNAPFHPCRSFIRTFLVILSVIKR